MAGESWARARWVGCNKRDAILKRIDWCSYKWSIEYSRVILNVLFPGIPPIWEGSKEGRVCDGDDDVKLIPWRPVFEWAWKQPAVYRHIKHHLSLLYEYIRDTVLFIARPRLASIGLGLLFSVGLPTPVNPTISDCEELSLYAGSTVGHKSFLTVMWFGSDWEI